MQLDAGVKRSVTGVKAGTGEGVTKAEETERQRSCLSLRCKREMRAHTTTTRRGGPLKYADQLQRFLEEDQILGLKPPLAISPYEQGPAIPRSQLRQLWRPSREREKDFVA